MTSSNPKSQQYLPSPPGYDHGYECDHFQQHGASNAMRQQNPPIPQLAADYNYDNTVVIAQPSSETSAVTCSRPPNLMPQAIVACWFCISCCWIGICAIIAASMANEAADVGDFKTANKRANIARILIIATFACGSIITVCIVAIIVYMCQSVE